MTERTVISTEGAARPSLPYSQAIRSGHLVFVAGQVATDPVTGRLVDGDVKAQTRRVLENARAILEVAGTSLERAVETLCFLSDGADFDAFNEAYREFFPSDPPARTTVVVSFPRPGIRVEIRVVAAMP